MSFDAAAAAAQLVSVMNGLTGISGVQIGAPASVGVQVSGYVTLGSLRGMRKATGTTRRESRFLCMFVYRLDGNETAAETTLMGLVDAFMAALYADLTLGGTVVDLEASSPAADEPAYQLRAGKEYREYPVVVTV